MIISRGSADASRAGRPRIPLMVGFAQPLLRRTEHPIAGYVRTVPPAGTPTAPLPCAGWGALARGSCQQGRIPDPRRSVGQPIPGRVGAKPLCETGSPATFGGGEFHRGPTSGAGKKGAER